MYGAIDMTKQPMILVYYMDDRDEDKELMTLANDIDNKFHQMSKDSYFPDDTVMFIIPHAAPNKIECINPIPVSDVEYKEISESISDISQRFKDFLTNREQYKIKNFLGEYKDLPF